MGNEKRLIDADSLLKKIHDTAEGLADCDQQNAAWALRKYAVRDIMDAETVDAVEVVRCKDCKYWGQDDSSYSGDFESFCTNPDGLDNYAHPDDFCSYGERKDGDGNG